MEHTMWALSHGHQMSGALRAAVELGVLHALDGKDASASELATATGCAERGVRILADALVALGAFEKHDQRYRIAARLSAELSPSSPDYRGDFVLLATYPLLLDAWAHAADAVRTGTTRLPRHAVSFGQEFWEPYARITAGFARSSGLELATALAGHAPRRILDLACGSGMVGIALLEQLAPAAELVQLDFPNVLDIARRNAGERGAALQQIAGDALTADLGGPYDLIVISQFLQMFDAETCVELLRRVRTAVPAGGAVAVCETLPDEARETNAHALLFAMMMLLWTPGGDMYRASDLTAMLTSAGYTQIRRVDSTGPRTWIIAS